MKALQAVVAVSIWLQPSSGQVVFGSLSKVGEMWYGGTWGKLDAHGVQMPGTCGDKGSKPCVRGEPGVTMMDCPAQSPRLLVLSPTAVVAMGNDTAQTSTDGGRSFSRYPGEDRADVYSGYIPAPAWLHGGGPGFMDITPVPSYPASCPTPANCTPASPAMGDTVHHSAAPPSRGNFVSLH